MKLAIIHDHLTQDGGAERVLNALQEVFPDAPIYTLVYDHKRMGRVFPRDRVRTSFLQRFPFAGHAYQWMLPLMPLATESYDLSRFDVVLSSSSAFAKGVITKSTTLHLCYCHTPTRYLWADTYSYVRELRVPGLLKSLTPFVLSRVRQWDRLAADRVDSFIANSKTVAERIQKHYRRESTVIYPPVEVEKFRVGQGRGEYYLAGGRLVSYKRIDIVIDAFNRTGMPLRIFGDGPEYGKLSRRAKKNIQFLGFVSDEERARLYQQCIAYINPQEEDFGITAIEAAAAGRPIIAYAAGGALETVIENRTGTFFFDQDAASLIDVLLRFKPEHFNCSAIREHARQYDVTRFKKEIRDHIERSWSQWKDTQQMKLLRDAQMHI